ncbi:MAG: right-handed parallel beta-helix repeat-containing protein [Acidobacteria bacterium]|nr:right-handed parallel beta-helix repeat-containing protein [Acidobacteriota bacterium]
MLKRMLTVLGMLAALAAFAAGGDKGRKVVPDETGADAVDLQALVDQAPDGGTVVVPSGRHLVARGLVVQGRKNLTIRGDRNSAVRVSDVMQNVIAISESEGIRLENLSLSHVSPLKDYQCHGAVVHVSDSSRVVVENCELNGCGASGVHAVGVNDLTVKRCHIHHNTFNAFYLDRCSKVLVQANLVENNANFMNLHQSDDLDMSDNVTRNNGGYWRPAMPAPPGSGKKRD